MAAAAGIRAATGSPAVDIFAADMSSQAQVRRLAAQVADTYPRLDVLVNNVGGFWAHRHVTADGLEHTFALNHLAPFLLTNLLLDRLTASAPARIVIVSSGAHARGRIDFDDLQGERNYSGQRAHSQSKLANVMFTYELARRLEGTGVTATVAHPGVVRTSFGAEDQAAYFAVMFGVARLFMKTPAQGALTPIYLAYSPQAEGVTGRYYVNRKPKTSSKASYDATAAARLWQCQRRTGRPDSNPIVTRRKHLDVSFVGRPPRGAMSGRLGCYAPWHFLTSRNVWATTRVSSSAVNSRSRRASRISCECQNCSCPARHSATEV